MTAFLSEKEECSLSNKKDKSLKKLEEYPDVAADIINGTLYHGQPVVKAEELALEPTSVLLHDADGELRERFRDIYVLHTRGGVRYAYIGIGNQSEVDNTLPLRVIEVDAGAYRKQIDQYMDENKQSGNDAFVRKIHADQKLIPTMTIVLFYGREWTGPRTLWDMLDIKEREGIKPYLLNYELNIIELGRDKELYRNFHSDFRMIVQYLGVRADRKAWKEFYEGFRWKIRHYREFLDAMEALTGDSRYRKLKEKIENEGKVKEGEMVEMCWLMDMAEERGEARGIKIGESRGIEIGKSQGEILGTEKALAESVQNLMKNLKMTMEQAMAALGIPEEKKEKLRCAFIEK